MADSWGDTALEWLQKKQEKLSSLQRRLAAFNWLAEREEDCIVSLSVYGAESETRRVVWKLCLRGDLWYIGESVLEVIELAMKGEHDDVSPAGSAHT